MLQFIISALLVLSGLFGIKFSVDSFTTSFTHYATSISNFALVGYALVVVGLAMFAVVLPVMSEAKGKKRHIHATTLFSIVLLFFGIFFLDLGVKNAIHESPEIALSNALRAGQTDLSVALKHYKPNQKGDISLFDIIMEGEEVDSRLLEAVIAKASCKTLNTPSSATYIYPSYTALGLAIKFGNQRAFDAIIKRRTGIDLEIKQGGSSTFGFTIPLTSSDVFSLAIIEGQKEMFLKLYEIQKKKKPRYNFSYLVESTYHRLKN